MPLSHQVAGHMYGKDKVGECGPGSPSPVFAVLCPGSPRPPLCPAPAVLGLRCPQPRWSSGVSRRHPDSHWPPLSPPRQFQASRSLSQLSPALLSPLWRSPASHPGHSCPRFFCSLPVSSQPPLFSTPGIFNLEFPAPVVLRVSPRPPSSGVGSRAPPGTATGFWWRGEACLFAPGKASVDWRRRC